MWEACSKGEIPYTSSMTNSEIRQRKLNIEPLPEPLVYDDWIGLNIHRRGVRE